MDEDPETSAAGISFGTDGWRARLTEFTTPRVRMVAQGVASYLDETDPTGPASNPAVAVGYDARETSRDFAEAVARVLAANGRDVWLAARDCPTPTTAWAVREHDLAGALVVTASHNPPAYNGIKFVPAGGAPALPDVTDGIEARLAPPVAGTGSEADRDDGAIEERDLISPYLGNVLDLVDADLSGRLVAYDAMFGSGRSVTDAALERSGADVRTLRCERDPDFGGGAPEPAADRVGDLIEAVSEGPADLGIVNDGDADRVAVITPERGYLDPNLFFAAIADYLLASGNSGDLVRTVSTSSLLDRVAADHGVAVHETAVGFKWVAEAMAQHDAVMGGEESAGFGLTGHLRNKDGVLFGLLAAAADAQRALDERVTELLERHGEIHQGKISVDCPDERKAPVLAELEDALPETIAGAAVDHVSTVDGFKIFLTDGSWLLIRPSGTEPKLRVYAEAGSGEWTRELLAAGREIVGPLV